MMKIIQLALSEKRKMQCESYIFPENYFDISGVEEFGDFNAVKVYAVEKMSPYANQNVDIYVNSGMSVLALAALQAGISLNTHLRMLNYDCSRKIYLPQTVKWKPLMRKKEKEPFSIALCQRRHKGMPEEAIFEPLNDEQLFDYLWQEEEAKKKLASWSQGEIYVYLSGLTQLSVSVLNAAYSLGISVTFFHYDHDNEDYLPQKMDE